VQKRIKFIVHRMENAIANHEFEKARFYWMRNAKSARTCALFAKNIISTNLPPEWSAARTSRTWSLAGPGCVMSIKEERVAETAAH